MIKTKSYAKLNLGLHVVPKKMKSNHYPIHFINCQINLYDEIVFDKANKIILNCNNPRIPTNNSNSIIKAVNLLKKHSKNKNLGVKITLNKKIPFTGGFSGGSSNAAVTLKEVSKLWNLKISNKKYLEFADCLGRDVFYNLIGGLCEIKGDGNIVQKLDYILPQLWLVVIVPDQTKPSTEFMYKNIDLNKVGRNLNKIELLKNAIKNKDVNEIFNNLYNDFEYSVEKLFPLISKVKNDLTLNDAKRTLLAGSGLSVVGFFKSEYSAKRAYDKLKKKYKNIFLNQTL